MDDVETLEKRFVPKGKVVLVGAGRLGVRVFMNLLLTHRGGFRVIRVMDGARIESNDYYHMLLGAEVGENKAEFLSRRFNTSESRRIEAIKENFSGDDRYFLDADIIVSTIAGGDTIPLMLKLSRIADEIGARLITTNGVFGYGSENILVYERLSDVERGPAVFLKELSPPDCITFVGTGFLIKDRMPIVPSILDRIANRMAEEALKEVEDE